MKIWKNFIKRFGKIKRGSPLEHKQLLLNRWKEHFKAEVECKDKSDEEMNVPDREEVICAIRGIQNNEACGRNGITAEITKCGGDTLTEKVCGTVKDMWVKEEMPEGRWLD